MSKKKVEINKNDSLDFGYQPSKKDYTILLKNDNKKKKNVVKPPKKK